MQSVTVKPVTTRRLKAQRLLLHRTLKKPCGTPAVRRVHLVARIRSANRNAVFKGKSLCLIHSGLFHLTFCVFSFQGTLPPPYSSTDPSGANGSLPSPVSTMKSQSSTSSLAKHRQSWLDLVSQASPPAGEAAVVCSAQVHSHQPPQEETHETDTSRAPGRSSQPESPETDSNEEEEAAQRVVSDTQEDDGRTGFYVNLVCLCLS